MGIRKKVFGRGEKRTNLKNKYLGGYTICPSWVVEVARPTPVESAPSDLNETDRRIRPEESLREQLGKGLKVRVYIESLRITSFRREGNSAKREGKKRVKGGGIMVERGREE